MTPSSAGCQCKVPGISLFEVIESAYGAVGITKHPMESAEDSAFLPNAPSNLLVSCDLATLVGTDITRAGRIAAFHAASDIYASGGIPLWGITIIVVPQDRTFEIATSLLTGILKGSEECGISVIGGQTIYGNEPMAGMTVLGTLRGAQPMRKKCARVGEHLYLSKPLGTSLALRAANEHQLGQISAEEAFSILTTSNGSASLAAVSADVHACSDVSGFGLLGHACQLLPDGLGAVISYSSVPLVDGVESVPNAFFQAPWLHSNLEYAQSLREIRTNFSFRDLGVLLDPQTNGGLLVAAYPTQSEPLLNAGYKHIGEVVAGSMITIAS